MKLSNLLIAALVAISGATTHAADLARYENSRFGFSMLYPPDFVLEPPPANGDGQVFSKAGQCSIRASGIHNVLDDTVASLERDRTRGFTTVTHRSRGRGWFGLAGVSGDRRLYVKAFVGKGYINELRIEQPSSGQPCAVATDLIVRSFKPGPLK